MQRFAHLAAIAALALGGCVSMEGPSDVGWSVADYARAARVDDDAMNPQVLVESAGPRTHSPVPNTYFAALRLRGTIDRRSGAEAVYVTLAVQHAGAHWLFPRGASYIAGDGIARQAQGFARAPGSVGGCTHWGNCLFAEGAAFPIDAAELERIVLRGQQRGETRYWGIRFRTDGGDFDYNMPFNEAEGFLEAFYRAQALAAATRAGAAQARTARPAAATALRAD